MLQQSPGVSGANGPSDADIAAVYDETKAGKETGEPAKPRRWEWQRSRGGSQRNKTTPNRPSPRLHLNRRYDSHMLIESSALERLIQPASGTLPAALAEYLLSLDFPPEDHRRYEELSAKAQRGALTAEEKVQLDDLLLANDVLMIFQSKARLSPARHTPAA